MNNVVCYGLALGLAMAFAFTGCDYGVADGEEPGDWNLEYSELEAPLGASEGNKVQFPGIVTNREMYLGFMDAPYWNAAPMPEDAKQKEAEESKNVGCDACAEQCAACMDGYICGHEAEILENCSACAQCQAGCNGALDAAD